MLLIGLSGYHCRMLNTEHVQDSMAFVKQKQSWIVYCKPHGDTFTPLVNSQRSFLTGSKTHELHELQGA